MILEGIGVIPEFFQPLSTCPKNRSNRVNGSGSICSSPYSTALGYIGYVVSYLTERHLYGAAPYHCCAAKVGV